MSTTNLQRTTGTAPATVRVGDVATPVGVLRVAVRVTPGPTAPVPAPPSVPVPVEGAVVERAVVERVVVERVVAAAFTDGFDRIAGSVRARSPLERWEEGPSLAVDALSRYVDGEVDALVDVDVDAFGTPFQQRVWQGLRRIPTGATWSYAEVARAIGSPTAMRAVGRANGANPVCVIVPCHRVVRADGSIGGYSAGLDRKRWLLEHEAVGVPPASAD